MVKLHPAVALAAASLVSAGPARAADLVGLKTGTVVTYTLSSDTSVRRVGTIVDIKRQASATWYSIETRDMECGKDRDVVRSDFVLRVGGTLPCGPAAPAAAQSPAPPAAGPPPADPLGRVIGTLRKPF